MHPGTILALVCCGSCLKSITFKGYPYGSMRLCFLVCFCLLLAHCLCFFLCILFVHCDMTNCRENGLVLFDNSWVLFNLYFLKATPKTSRLGGKVRWMLEPM